MDAGQIQKLVDVDLAQLTARATNPRATLGALGQKIVAAMESVEQQMADLDARALEIPVELDTGAETLKKLEAVIAKAQNDGRPDLQQAAGARLQKQLAAINALQAEGDGIDTQIMALDELLQKLQNKQIDIDGAIASAPPDVKGVVTAPVAFELPESSAPKAAASAPAPKPVAVAPAPKPAAAPAPAPKPAPSAAPAKKGGDALDDEFAALFAAENLSLDDVQLPAKSLKKAIKLPDSDDGIPDLVMVADGELPDDATDEDRAPIPTVPQKGAPGKGAPAKAAAAAPVAAKLPGAKVPVNAPQPAPGSSKLAGPAGKTPPAKNEDPPRKGRVWVWVGTAAVLGGGGWAIAHFIYGVI